MIITFFIWIYIVWISLSWGIVFHSLLLRITAPGQEKKTSPDLVILTGFSMLLVFLGYLYCFISISALANLIVIFLTLCFNYFYFKDLKKIFFELSADLKKQKTIGIILYVVFLFFMLFASSLSPSQFGTGYYHAQAVQWIEQYKLVPGIANLSVVLGYNNSIQLAFAFFSGSFSGFEFHSVNGFLLALAGIRMIHELRSGKNFSLIFIALLILVILNYFKIISSLGSDIAVSVFAIYLFVFLIKSRKDDYGNVYYFAVLLFLMLTVISIKLSGVILLPVFFLGFLKYFRFSGVKKFILLGCICLFVLCPWAIRGYATSGYLVYPYQEIDLFQPDWKVPVKTVQLQQEFIRAWTRSQNKISDLQKIMLDGEVKDLMEYEQKMVTETKQQSFFVTLKQALTGSSLRERIMMGLTILTLLTFPFLAYSRKGIINRQLFQLLFFYNAGLCIWFFIAPDLRFGNVLIIISLFSTVCLLLELMKMDKVNNMIGTALQNKVFLTVVIVFCMFFYSSNNFKMIKNCWMFPEGYKKTELTELGGQPVKVFTPKNIEKDFLQCWNAPLPCIPDTAIHFEMRTGNITGGFKAKHN